LPKSWEHDRLIYLEQIEAMRTRLGQRPSYFDAPVLAANVDEDTQD
jgi:hypothetical protein